MYFYQIESQRFKYLCYYEAIHIILFNQKNPQITQSQLFFLESSEESIVEATSEEERDVQELTLDLEKKEPVKELEQEDLESSPADTGEIGENDYEPTQDDTEDLIDNSSHKRNTLVPKNY